MLSCERAGVLHSGLRAQPWKPGSVDVTNHHLRVITAIADAGSIGRAALRLGTSHAALSAQLRRIERAMGGDLFVRSNAGCVPTPFGDAVLADARQQAHAEPGETMHVQIGGYAGIMLGELGRRIAGEPWASGVHLRDNPDSRVNVRMVADGDVDLALVYDWPPVAIPRPAKVRERIVLPDEPVFVMMSERTRWPSHRQCPFGHWRTSHGWTNQSEPRRGRYICSTCAITPGCRSTWDSPPRTYRKPVTWS